MHVLRPLDLKVLRDAGRMKGQLTAIACVMACGVGVYLGMRTTMSSLAAARSNYYAHERFGDVFAGLKRAPERVGRKLRAIPGVQHLQTRVVADVTLDVPGMTQTALGRLVSLPDHGRPTVNDVRLQSGRMPETGRWEEVLVSEAFADAHRFPLGTTIGAVINGKHEALKIVGTALSPEYTYALGPGLLFPDDRRFGVMWMRRRALAPAFEMEGAFNDVSLRIARDAKVDAILAQVDRILERYGGRGAIARKDQLSAFFLDNELVQLQTFAVMMPVLFLAVAAFLLNVVIGRIIAGQRGEIAVLKAFGYRDREVGLHYAKLVGVVLALGGTLGIVVAARLGSWLTQLYAEFFRFPELPFEMGLADIFTGIGLSAVAAGLGTWTAIWRTVRLPPAEAMRPEAPPAYRPTLVERWGLSEFVPTAARIILREIERKPRRALLSVLGIAMAMGLTIANAFFFDSVRYLLNVQFGLNQREDVQLTLFEPRAIGVLSSLEHLPGVLHAEPFRQVPVKFFAGPRVKSGSIIGVPADATLTTLLGVDLEDIALPPDGLILSRKLAEILDVSTNDMLRIKVLEGARPEREVRVVRIAETFVGTTAHMQLRALCSLLGEPESLNGAWLMVDPAQLDRLHAVVKAVPIVAGVTARDDTWASAQEMIDQNLGRSVVVSLSFSLVMAFGVLYNAVRITLAERAHEMASLRVLGFRQREVGAILLGELALLVVMAIPLGLLCGWGLAAVLVRTPGFNTEQFRLPLVISSATYMTAVLTVLAAAGVSGWNAWRQLSRIDIVDVLKTRD